MTRKPAYIIPAADGEQRITWQRIDSVLKRAGIKPFKYGSGYTRTQDGWNGWTIRYSASARRYWHPVGSHMDRIYQQQEDRALGLIHDALTTAGIPSTLILEEGRVTC